MTWLHRTFSVQIFISVILVIDFSVTFIANLFLLVNVISIPLIMTLSLQANEINVAIKANSLLLAKI